MYHLSPYTYLIGGLVGQGWSISVSLFYYYYTYFCLSAVGREPIQCAQKELVTVEPPDGATCIDFLRTFISNKGGSLSNPSATSGCLFCSSATTDEFLGPQFNIFYSLRWRNLGIFCAYIAFNVRGVAFYLIFRVDMDIRRHSFTF
jgi:ATP-binding cassette subfamily G (WHITE) protein 2 (SNQ2)